MTKPSDELTLDDPAPSRHWVPTLEQIWRWAAEIRRENEAAAGLTTMSEHELSMMTDDETDDEPHGRGSKCH